MREEFEVFKSMAQNMLDLAFQNLEKDLTKRITTEIKGQSFITDHINSLKGDKGDSIQGPRGYKGDKGDKGDSIQGPQGITGKDGKTPIAGVDYHIPKDGKDGVDGKDGKDGKDGSPDTPDQVVVKVNKADKKILLSTLDGFYELIAEMKTAIRQKGGSKGGGMGNPQIINETVQPTTTTITLSSGIAANGSAIWLHNGGAWLVRGTHFNSTGDGLITLLFEPADNSKIEGLYIRG